MQCNEAYLAERALKSPDQELLSEPTVNLYHYREQAYLCTPGGSSKFQIQEFMINSYEHDII